MKPAALLPIRNSPQPWKHSCYYSLVLSPDSPMQSFPWLLWQRNLASLISSCSQRTNINRKEKAITMLLPQNSVAEESKSKTPKSERKQAVEPTLTPLAFYSYNQLSSSNPIGRKALTHNEMCFSMSKHRHAHSTKCFDVFCIFPRLRCRIRQHCDSWFPFLPLLEYTVEC